MNECFSRSAPVSWTRDLALLAESSSGSVQLSFAINGPNKTAVRARMRHTLCTYFGVGSVSQLLRRAHSSLTFGFCLEAQATPSLGLAKPDRNSEAGTTKIARP